MPSLPSMCHHTQMIYLFFGTCVVLKCSKCFYVIFLLIQCKSSNMQMLPAQYSCTIQNRLCRTRLRSSNALDFSGNNNNNNTHIAAIAPPSLTIHVPTIMGGAAYIWT